MPKLTYDEEDRKTLEDILVMSEAVWNWWIVNKTRSEHGRELARRKLESIHRLQKAMGL